MAHGPMVMVKEDTMLCQDLMKKDIICCSDDESIFDCATKMNRENVGFVPICKKDHADGHRVIGTLTDRDIVLRVVAFQGGRDPRAVKAGEVMSKDPVSCKPTDDIGEAADLMAEHQISAGVRLRGRQARGRDQPVGYRAGVPRASGRHAAQGKQA